MKEKKNTKAVKCLTYEEKFDIVIQVIVDACKKYSFIIILDFTPGKESLPNKQLALVSELGTLKILRELESKRLVKINIPRPFNEPKRWLAGAPEPPEVTHIISFDILPEFNNWYWDYCFKKDLKESKEIMYQITFELDTEILLNNIPFSKVNYSSQNAIVFKYLYNNSNRKIDREELEKEIEKQSNRSQNLSLHKIVESLGFTKNFLKVFFNVSHDAILFRNPITKRDFKKLGSPELEIKKGSKKTRFYPLNLPLLP